MRVYSKSDIGLVRSTNQDYCRTGIFPDGAAWAVVCDGMGGANGGSTASSLAVETIVEKLSEGYISDMEGEQLSALLGGAVEAANTVVYETAQNDELLSGMGTTVVCAIVKNGKAHIVHAGDSRAYFYDGDTVRQVTKDHSIVQELVDLGRIKQEEARFHPNRNLITRALGIAPELSTDYNAVDFDERSVLLICTDGLSNYITEERLTEFIRDSRGEELSEQLIESAKRLGGSDNITVAVIASGEE